VPGRGVEGEVGGVRYRIGRTEYVLEGLAGVPQSPTIAADDAQTVILLGSREQVLAAFLLSDALRANVPHTVRDLQALGLDVQIASGDRESVVQKCACQLQITQAHGAMSAQAKLDLLRNLQAAGRRVLVVGDGINDAAVLAAADVSIALGSGADLAQVNADMILLGENLSGLPESIETTRSMLTFMRQNLTWAVLYNLAAVPLAVSGWLQPWMAAVGMSLSSLLVVLNALRLLPMRARSSDAVHASPRTVPA
jgi:P-type Cu2+ transporter